MIGELRIDRVLAPNAGLFTGPGTNTYVIGDDRETLVLDPGPIDSGHEQAIIRSVGSRLLSAVVVTHTHPDHAPMANPLARSLGVPAYGYGPGPEFDPDVRLADGSVVRVGNQALSVVHTPGHADDHLCFRLGSTLFTGDHIMGGSSVMVNDMGPYLASLRRLAGTGLTRLLPGHGEPMDAPDEVISWYIAHRLDRERQIVGALWRRGRHRGRGGGVGVRRRRLCAPPPRGAVGRGAPEEAGNRRCCAARLATAGMPATELLPGASSPTQR